MAIYDIVPEGFTLPGGVVLTRNDKTGMLTITITHGSHNHSVMVAYETLISYYYPESFLYSLIFSTLGECHLKETPTNSFDTSNYQRPPSSFYSTFPILNKRVKHPNINCYADWGGSTLTVTSLIVHLNDVHRWTREQIADWLDELEKAGYDQRAVV